MGRDYETYRNITSRVEFKFVDVLGKKRRQKNWGF